MGWWPCPECCPDAPCEYCSAGTLPDPMPIDYYGWSSGAYYGSPCPDCTVYNGSYLLPYIGQYGSFGISYCLWSLTFPTTCVTQATPITSPWCSSIYFDVVINVKLYIKSGVPTWRSEWHWIGCNDISFLLDFMLIHEAPFAGASYPPIVTSDCSAEHDLVYDAVETSSYLPCDWDTVSGTVVIN